MKFVMPLRLSSLLVLFVASVLANAQSFEKMEDAKANVILKTTQSWDTSPIKYPDEEAQVTVVTLTLLEKVKQ